MWIERVKAHPFGPMIDEELEFGPGLNVVLGPNESGKSSWHAALYAALCGMRRSRGSPRREDRAFSERHKPWNSSRWHATAVLHLEDGRRIEIRQDLASQVDRAATDLALGRDVSSEIIRDGAPDGSHWLGLDRGSFLSVACVRQAEVLSVADKESADGLQPALQRAAASVPAESTADAAIRLLKEFTATQVGTDRAPTRPLRQAATRLESAREQLKQAERDHRDYIEIWREVDRAREAAEASRQAVQAAEAAAALRDAARLRGRFEEARRILAEFPDGEPPPPSAGEVEARHVASLLDRWERRRQPQPLDGPSAAELRQQMSAAQANASGDREVHPSVRNAWKAWSDNGVVLAEHERQRPTRIEEPYAGGYSLAELYQCADELAASAAPAAPAVHGSPFWWVASGGVAMLAVLFAVIGLAIPAVALFAVAVTLGVLALTFSRRAVPGIAGDPAEHLRADLHQLQLPTTPAALRQLALSVSAAQQRQREIETWSNRREEMVRAVEQTRDDLRASLRARGVEIDQHGDAQVALERYESECRFRRDGSGRLAAMTADIRLRESAERQNDEILQELAALESNLREAAAATGTDLAAGHPLESVVSALEQWNARQDARSLELDRRLQQRTRLELLLDGLTLEELEAQAGVAGRTAQRLADGVPAASLATAVELADAGDTWLAGLDVLRAADREARERLAMLSERLTGHSARMRSAAADQEAVAAAEAKLQRLQSLNNVLQLTTKYMESAVERAHRSIAPVLEASLTRRLPGITNGRYVEAKVDPDNLAVRVRAPGAPWRDAQRLSHGTTEQIYLLLRVALAEHLVKAGEVIPLVFDDVTVHSDRERTEAIMDTLLHLSEERQVVVFSQESEVAEWAAAHVAGPRHRVIELGPIPAGR